MSQILFVCSGNTCRSPMAEGLFRLLAAQSGKQSSAASCGLNAAVGAPASSGAQHAAATCCFSLAGHRAAAVTEALLAQADRVYPMTESHLRLLELCYPEQRYKLRRMPGGDVPDPYGGSDADYRRCLARLKADVSAILEELP